MTKTFILTSALLWGKCRNISSWVLPPIQSGRAKFSRSTGVIESSRPSIFFEDESECRGDEECEIDWSSMPGFDDDVEEEATKEPIAVKLATDITNSEDPDCPDEEECEIDWSLMPGFDDEEEDENEIPKETAAVESPTNIFNSDPDCPDEEECEIDWSLMPGFDDEEEDENEIPKETAAVESPTNIFNSDPDCPDEEECEIDWSLMPGFDDDDDDDEAKKETPSPSDKAQNFGPAEEEYEEINEKLNELEPKEVYVRQVPRSIEKSRTHLEMNWQIADCAVDKDTCADICSECAGSGKVPCQFCNGTGMIAFLDEFRSCILCKDGLTDCKSCVGTGSIASWAKTHDGS